MNIHDFVGLIVTVFVLLFVLFRNIREVVRQNKSPEEEHIEREKSRRVRKILKDLDLDDEDDEEEEEEFLHHTHAYQPPAPKPIAKPRPVVQQTKKPVKYEIFQKKLILSRGSVILNKLSTPQEMMVIHEIIGPPKGLS